jgi:glucose-6-phosphate dehydrogenase assembly protein OpcA
MEDAVSSPAIANPFIATIVIVGDAARVAPAAQALDELNTRGSVRGILITPGDNPAPRPKAAGSHTELHGLRPDFINNAVAAYRFSSLPTVVWWRGGDASSLDGLADLSDRLVLDADDPRESWTGVARLFDRSVITDLRWARLTRWRALMAHFFDIPNVLAQTARFDRVTLRGSDQWLLRLFGGWLTSALAAQDRIRVDLDLQPAAEPIEVVDFGDGRQQLTMRLLTNSQCVSTHAAVDGHAGAARTVALGDRKLSTLFASELRVRSRDLAFERALTAIIPDL